MAKLNEELCVARLKELIGELETRSSNEGQPLRDWLGCVKAMAEEMKNLTELVADEVGEEDEDD